jgi:hypothetical protein
LEDHAAEEKCGQRLFLWLVELPDGRVYSPDYRAWKA